MSVYICSYLFQHNHPQATCNQKDSFQFHTLLNPVNILLVAIYAQGVFHLNTWKMKIVWRTSCNHSNIVRGIGPNIGPLPGPNTLCFLTELYYEFKYGTYWDHGKPFFQSKNSGFQYFQFRVQNYRLPRASESMLRTVMLICF